MACKNENKKRNNNIQEDLKMIKDLTKFERDLKNTVTWILEEMPESKKRVLN